MRIITTRNDLRQWVSDSGGRWDGCTPAERDQLIETVTDALRAGRPASLAWGDDWEDYLDEVDLSGIIERVVSAL